MNSAKGSCESCLQIKCFLKFEMNVELIQRLDVGLDLDRHPVSKCKSGMCKVMKNCSVKVPTVFAGTVATSGDSFLCWTEL